MGKIIKARFICHDSLEQTSKDKFFGYGNGIEVSDKDCEFICDDDVKGILLIANFPLNTKIGHATIFIAESIEYDDGDSCSFVLLPYGYRGYKINPTKGTLILDRRTMAAKRILATREMEKISCLIGSECVRQTPCRL